MSTALPMWEGLHTIGANILGFGVDGGAFKYIAAGDYYWRTVADGGSVSLISAIQTLLTTAPNAVASTVATVSTSLGKITIQWGSGSHSLEWANTYSRTRCGATGDFAAATQLQFPNQVRGLWLPNVAGSNNGSVAGPGQPESDRKVTLSRSGAMYATSNSERRRVRWEFGGLSKAKTWTANEGTTVALETFWRDALNYRAGIFRHYPDRSDSLTYETWQSLLTSGLRPKRRKGAYDEVWDSGEIEAISYVHVATGGGF